jgi:hypothetical protein
MYDSFFTYEYRQNVFVSSKYNIQEQCFEYEVIFKGSVYKAKSKHSAKILATKIFKKFNNFSEKIKV